MKKFLYNQREILALFVYIAIVYSFVVYFVKPLYDRVVATRNEIQEQIVLQEIKAKTLSELPKIRQQYQLIENNRQNFSSILKKDEEVLLIENLERLAQQTQNDIKIGVTETSTVSNKSQRSSKEQAGKSITQILGGEKYQQFSVIISGNYQSIINFIEKLEALSYYSDVLSIDMRKGDSVNQPSGNMFAPAEIQQEVEQKKNDLTATISVVFYVLE